MKLNMWCSDNIVFGMGGGLLQKINRDTQRFAFKCCFQKRKGQWYDIQKKPIDETKRSKRGHLALIKDDDGYQTLEQLEPGIDQPGDILKTVFYNGKLVCEYSLDDIRKKASL